MNPRLVLCLLITCVLAACGGGSGGSSLPPTLAPGTSSSATARVTVSIHIPATQTASVRRTPLYVSTKTQSASLTVNGGQPVIVNLLPTSPNCTNTPQGLTCNVVVDAPIGTDTFAETLYDAPLATGHILSQGTTSAAILAGQANTVNLTLSGVVAKITLVLATSTPPTGTAATIPLTVTMLDAGGAAIIGDPFANPIALTDSDTSGVTSISKTTLTSPQDASGLTVHYSGAPLAQAVFGATASGVSAANVTPATLTPQAPGSVTLNDWSTYGYDNQRSGFNPNTSAFTPASLAQVHLAWQAGGIDFNTQTQPVIATNVAGHKAILIVGGGGGLVFGYDAITGVKIWSRTFGEFSYTCGSGGSTSLGGVSGTVAYDPASKSLYVMASTNGAPNSPAANTIYHLDAATGATLGSVNIAAAITPLAGELNFAHTALTLANGFVYAGTGSTCDISSWRGRITAVNASTMQVARTFFTAYGQGGNFSGAGVWSWGGMSVDASGNVYGDVGNTDTSAGPQPPFAQAANEFDGYGEHLVKLSSDLSTVGASNYPGFTFGQNSVDLDLVGTPVLFKPLSCNNVIAAASGKAGQLLLYDTQSIGAGPVAKYAFSVSSFDDSYLSNPAYSPVTGLLYAPVASADAPSIEPAGMVAIKSNGCGSGSFSILWNARFGDDSYAYPNNVVSRSAPTVTAGGVVFMATPCTPNNSGGCGAPGTTVGGAVFAIDASTGTVLNGGKPLLTTSGPIRMPPTVDGNWMWVIDNNGDLYGMTLDQSVPAVAKIRQPLSSRKMIPYPMRPK